MNYVMHHAVSSLTAPTPPYRIAAAVPTYLSNHDRCLVSTVSTVLPEPLFLLSNQRIHDRVFPVQPPTEPLLLQKYDVCFFQVG